MKSREEGLASPNIGLQALKHFKHFKHFKHSRTQELKSFFTIRLSVCNVRALN